MNTSDQILSFYRQSQESKRLTDAKGQLEFVRTQEIVMRYLLPPPATVLDVGGGTGPYACWLAKAGYEVHLVDPVDLHVEQAKEASNQQPENPIASISLGDARSLSFPSMTADAVLLLGPLYHLIDESDRILALREAYRTLRNGGFVFAVGISRFASLFDGFFKDLLSDSAFRAILAQDLETGHHRNLTGNPAYFTDAYFHRPQVLRAELVKAGFQHQATLAIEGPAWIFETIENYWSDPDRREMVLALI